jgi:hypothetical protein
VDVRYTRIGGGRKRDDWGYCPLYSQTPHNPERMSGNRIGFLKMIGRRFAFRYMDSCSFIRC